MEGPLLSPTTASRAFLRKIIRYQRKFRAFFPSGWRAGLSWHGFLTHEPAASIAKLGLRSEKSRLDTDLVGLAHLL
jgi:hypothetical protein